MSRWQPDARERLERAAMELFREHGFAATTVPDIAARAGLTTRTFFRHFADKREVIFAGDEIPGLAARLLADAPAGEPLEIVLGGLRFVTQSRFDGRVEQVRLIRDLIASDPSLQERELRKRAALAEVIRDGFVARGMESAAAALLAETSVTLLHVAIDAWLATDGTRPLFDFVLDARSTLRSLVGAGV